MAPTIHIDPKAERDRKQRTGEKKSELVCRVKYSNTLPDIPFDPKFITYPFLPNRFVEYKPTSLERNTKHDLLTEHDLGVTIDLINPDTYAEDPKAALHEDDEKLLEEEISTPEVSQRSQHHKKAVPWLKKTEYISNEFNRYGHSSEKTETKVGYNVKRLFKEENVYMDRDSQINAINKTFSDSKKKIEQHYSKPGVYSLEELPVFPDFDLWKYPFAQVLFDTDPAPSTQMEHMSAAMIRGVMDDSGHQFVAYFLPTEETLRKRKLDIEGVDMEEEKYEYKMAREYNWNVKNKASQGYEENYFFVIRDKSVYYNVLETRVRLNKRRVKNPGMPPKTSILQAAHRPLTDAEWNQQNARLRQLEAVQLEEEEEEVEEENREGEEKERDGSEASGGEERGSEDSRGAEQGSEAEENNEERNEEEEGEEQKSEAEEEERSGSEAESEDERKEADDDDEEKKSSPRSSDSEDENLRKQVEIFGSDSD